MGKQAIESASKKDNKQRSRLCSPFSNNNNNNFKSNNNNNNNNNFKNNSHSNNNNKNNNNDNSSEYNIINNKKKKGRPSKSDVVGRRHSPSAEPPAAGPRRSLRPLRRRRGLEDDSEPFFYEYDDDDDDDEDEGSNGRDRDIERKRREKKLTVVLRLNRRGRRSSGIGPRNPDLNSSGVSAASSCDNDSKPLKKRRINGRNGPDGDGDDDDDDNDDDDNDCGVGIVGVNDDDDIRSNRSEDDEPLEEKRNEVPKCLESVSGAKTESSTPLPDKKMLEFILHKLQKKDTYGVYADPVDPEELPDYHDVIEHPMDFGTIRKKLASNTYTSLEQFESDVFLICTNAMQYNAPDTIYHKQARAIQELATKRFDKLRVSAWNGMELESAETSKLNSESVANKPMKSTSMNGNEPVSSDFTTGATLANAGDSCACPNNAQAASFDKPGSVDCLVLDINPHLDENKHDKAEEFIVRGIPSKFGRRLSVVDENRRLTYNSSEQVVSRTETVFSTFENEVKQLVVVGLHADHSYARSLARFAATLGPVAWRIASRRIEQALPAGYKFGRGWVGEFEPLQTPVLSFGNRSSSLSAYNTKSQQFLELKAQETREKASVTQDAPKSVQLSSRNSAETVSNQTPNHSGTDAKPSWFGSGAGAKPAFHGVRLQQQQNSLDRESNSDHGVMKQIEVSSSSSVSTIIPNDAAQIPESCPPAMASRLREMALRNNNLRHSLSASEQASISGNIGVRVDSRAVRLPNGRSRNNLEGPNSMGSSSVGLVPSQHAAGSLSIFGHINNERSLNDQVKAMMMSSGKMENQLKPLKKTVADNLQVAPPVVSSKRDDSSTAVAAAKAWMSIGAQGLKPTEVNMPQIQIAAASLYNPTRELPNTNSHSREDNSGLGRLQSEQNRFPSQSHPQSLHFGADVRFQNIRPANFPHLVAADMSRFHVQSPWRGLSPQNSQQKPKADMLPPDLNIGFQPPGSPIRQQSSGIQVDSQQPDLALQL